MREKRVRKLDKLSEAVREYSEYSHGVIEHFFPTWRFKMEMAICSIQDTVAGAWTNPMYFHSNAAAIRSFQEAVNDPSTNFGKNPTDYCLFNLGLWNERTGEITVHEAPMALGVGSNFVSRNGEE